MNKEEFEVLVRVLTAISILIAAWFVIFVIGYVIVTAIR